jgi:hypothetical protein
MVPALAATVTAGAQTNRPDAAASRMIQFNRDIRPILSEKCFTCHGPDKSHRVSVFRLDVEESAKQDLGGGHFIIVPSDPDSSALVQRITSTDDKRRMPPVSSGRTLTPQEIALLEAWVQQGAKWEKHWSYVPPVRPAVPRIAHAGWTIHNPIDNFVLRKLEQDGLAPAAPADRATLIRRVTLDLTGIGPTPDEVDAFVADRSPNAYEKVVDRLLRSPRYGERMAVPWLDAARYSDTSGYFVDYDRFMWRWRDWVIEAFNKNMPYDQFTIEQLAGDLLPNPTLDQKIATAFNRNHRTNEEAGVVAAEYAPEYPADRVATMSTVFLGSTLGTCARCHDHKYDPFTQNEFYQLFAFFNNVPELGTGDRGNTRPRIKAPTREQQAALTKVDNQIAAATGRLRALESSIAAAETAWLKSASLPAQWAPTRGLIAYYPLDGDLTAHLDLPKPKPTRGRENNPNGNQDVTQENFGRGRGPVTPTTTVPAWRGEAKFAAGMIGQAAVLDGTSYIDAGNVGDFGDEFTTELMDKFSLSAWILPTAGNGTIISRTPDLPVEKGYYLQLKDGHLHMTIAGFAEGYNAIRMDSDATVPMNEWHHVAVTVDGTRVSDGVKVYLDGRSVHMKVPVDFLTLSPNVRDPLRIGAGGGPNARFHGSIDEVRVYNVDLSADEIAVLASSRTITDIAAAPRSQWSAGEAGKVRHAFLDSAAAPANVTSLVRQIATLQDQRTSLYDAVNTVSVMEELPTPRETHLLIRGAYDNPGDVVTPAVPAMLPPMPASYPKNRLGLAKWLVDGSNPLTARVAVNRFWQMYFGTGIVKTLDDFGSQGEPPSDPELLDWLATEFVRTGWNIKALQKTMVMSAAYQQDSRATPDSLQRDPENRLLARGPRFRLPAEVIRDQALAVSGLLVEKLGGPSVKPYQPEGLWAELTGAERYVQDHGDNLYRRSLYTFWKRTITPPSMLNFDAATRESCTVQRSATNSPLQSLDLMNNVTYVEAARLLGERMLKEGGTTPQQRLTFAYRLAASRRPTEREMNVLTSSLQHALDRFKSRPDAAAKYLQHGEHPRDQRLDASELAAYSTTASLILNMDSTISKE